MPVQTKESVYFNVSISTCVAAMSIDAAVRESVALSVPVRFRALHLLLAGAVGVVAFGAYVLVPDRPLDRACPESVRSSLPVVAVHLAPSARRHQSWVRFPWTELPPNVHVYACTDGLAIGERIAEFDLDPSPDLMEVKIPTRWVNLTWLMGNLDPYRDPARWRVVIASR
jgi:hypothetical protein